MAFYTGFVGIPKNNKGYRGKTYTYLGPVYRNGFQLGTYSGDTRAYTPEKAFENLTFRARKEAGSCAEDMSIQLDYRYLQEKYR